MNDVPPLSMAEIGTKPTNTQAWQSFTCQASEIPASPLRRLTFTQYRNTLQDLLAATLPDWSGVWKEVLPLVEALPVDQPPKLGADDHGTFRRLAQEVPQTWVDGSYTVARRLGELLAQQHLTQVAGACAVSSPSRGCLEGFLKTFGARALRAPLGDDDIAFYAKLYGDPAKSNPAGYAAVIGALLSAPQFLYRVEHGGAPAGAGYRLTAHELAARLSYQFWDSLPDAELWSAANSGALLTPQGYAQQVERVFQQPRTREALGRFFSEWMLLDEIPALDSLKEDKAFITFVGASMPTPQLRASMMDELLDLGQHFVWTKAGSFDDLLTTDHHFAKNAALARLYGQPTWSGAGTPPAFPAGKRPGYLTRAGMLASGLVKTRPVMRGVFLRTKVLCDEIPPPPPNAMDETDRLQLMVKPNMSTREEFTLLTETSSACAGCHQALINPLGWPLESFDALGRERMHEPIIDGAGKVVAMAALDTSSVPQVTPGDRRTARTAAELIQLLRESGKAHACFARQYVRFSEARAEDVQVDGCALGTLVEAMKEGATLPTVFKRLAYLPSFQQRTF